MKTCYMLVAVVAILQLLDNTEASDFIKTSCDTTRFPELCFNSLKTHAGKIQTSPKALAETALNLALESAKQTQASMNTFSTSQGGMDAAVKPAITDCVEQLDNAVEGLQKSKDELSQIVELSSSGLKVGNVQTWVSAAYTDVDTCIDGFGEITKKEATGPVHKQVTEVAELTSNALAFINSYAKSAIVSS